MGVPAGVRGRVAAVDPCPPLAAGPGRVVLTAVSHPNDFVFDLTLRGGDGTRETLGVTGHHKLYREGLGWTSVRALSEGDALRGRGGATVTVAGLRRRAGACRVYNLTVEADHVYHVGTLDTLAHNNDCLPTPPRVFPTADGVVPVKDLKPPLSRPMPDPDKLRRMGPFDWSKYTPIEVRPVRGGKLQVMSGMTRWEAALKAGVTHLPAQIHGVR